MNPRFVRQVDAEYPPRLREVKPSVPGYWILGRALHEMPRAVGIVGPRNPTPYGTEVARTLARGLTHAGCVVVSGMARGVDAVAHEAALRAGGETIAVLGTGIDVPYPSENEELYARIVRAGAVISEQPPETRGFKANFPKRNRIIAGLSLAVVVVQAGIRSGALSTAAHARENNRDVLAVPGDIRSPLSEGVHALIRDGAGVCTGVHDVLEAISAELARLPKPYDEPVEIPAGLSPLEQAVMRALSRELSPVSEIAKRGNLSKAQTGRALLVLEMMSLAMRGPNDSYRRRSP